MKHAVIAAVAPALLAGCVTYHIRGEPGFVGLNQSATVGPVRVTPLAVLEASRCPRGVQCVWAGRVRIEARVAGVRRELFLGQAIAVSGGQLELSEVAPAKAQGAIIAPRDYRFRFTFR
jgi:hypothetical protein